MRMPRPPTLASELRWDLPWVRAFDSVYYRRSDRE